MMVQMQLSAQEFHKLLSEFVSTGQLTPCLAHFLHLIPKHLQSDIVEGTVVECSHS